MYWDSLTATGIFISIGMLLGAFYLEFRNRPGDAVMIARYRLFAPSPDRLETILYEGPNESY